jgi:hypothetical protein
MPKYYVKITVRAFDDKEKGSNAHGQLNFADMPKKGDDVAIGSNRLQVTGIEWASLGNEYVPIIHLEGLCFPYRGSSDTPDAVASEIRSHLDERWP